MELKQALRRIWMTGLGAAAFAAPAYAHPHIFAEARLDVMVDPAQSTIVGLRHVWRFDDAFSATVIVEFDKNGDRKLDDAEIEGVRQTVFQSMAEFNYFQTMSVDNKESPLAAPEAFVVTFENNQMLFLFEAKPKEPIRAKGLINIGVYDPTFYTGIEFLDDKDMALSAPLPNCSTKVVRPDPDEAIAANQENLTQEFFDNPESNDMTKLFATRLEIACPAGQG